MEIKVSILGGLIYGAIGFYLLGFFNFLFHKLREGRAFILLGFLCITAGVVLRGITVGHLPMRNVFELFLCLGMLIYPISILSRCGLDIHREWADALIGVIVLFPAGFVFKETPGHLPPALQSWMFGPHVATYMLSYAFMAKSCIEAIVSAAYCGIDLEKAKRIERGAQRLANAGFPLLTMGLILGSIWAKIAWGEYWGWDPKEMWALASWLVYGGYFHFRFMFGQRYTLFNNAWLISGMAVIVLTLLWVNFSSLFPGLHSYAL